MTEVPEVAEAIIFINYRRTDAGWPADLLRSELGRSFGEAMVFLDVRGVNAGDDFVAVLDSQLRRATILIVLIGENWLHVADKFGRRRLDQEHDWVRREIRMALQKQGCRIIPVLIDDAHLPDEKEALPEDISALLTRQRFYLRQAHSDDDIDALSREIEKTGFRRLASSPEPLSGQRFSDRDVNAIVLRLQRLHAQQNQEFLGQRELFRELDLLFNRKTFRFEALRGCPEQRWADRLDSAYQTLQVLQGYVRNVREVAEDKYTIYRDPVMEVDLYCMQMGALLFDPAVDYNRIQEHIGKTTFKAQLPKEIWFHPGVDKQPEIPDVINDRIEPHRLRAVALMDQLANPRKLDAGSSSDATLTLRLLNTDSEGFARGEWTQWGLDGPRAYFYHLIVGNPSSESAREVWVELKAVSKHVREEIFENTLTRRLPLRKPDDGEECSAGYVRGHDESTWNFGYLATHLKQFQFDIYKRDWPVNFQGIVGANGRLRVEVVAIAANARSEPLVTEISWDGEWIDDDADTMKHHLQVRELHR